MFGAFLSLSVSVSSRPQGCALHFKQFSYRRKAVGSATPVVMRLGYAKWQAELQKSW
jgi:hypothetical protein